MDKISYGGLKTGSFTSRLEKCDGQHGSLALVLFFFIGLRKHCGQVLRSTGSTPPVNKLSKSSLCQCMWLNLKLNRLNGACFLSTIFILLWVPFFSGSIANYLLLLALYLLIAANDRWVLRPTFHSFLHARIADEQHNKHGGTRFDRISYGPPGGLWTRQGVPNKELRIDWSLFSETLGWILECIDIPEITNNCIVLISFA